MDKSDLDTLVAAVLQSNKYRSVDPGLIRQIGARELLAHTGLKAAVKETKNKLHQVAGAFLDRPPRYGTWLAEMRAAKDDPAALRATCRSIMAGHASTRERLPGLEHFYSTIFAALPPVNSVLDLACGLNPLAALWMPLTPGTHYAACDLYSDLSDFLGEALPLLGLKGSAGVCDLSSGAPPVEADVALLLKTLPVLEQLRRGAGHELLRAIKSPCLVVSFPTRSLGGRNVGMAAQYAGYMQGLIDEGWAQQRLEFANELVFVVRKDGERA